MPVKGMPPGRAGEAAAMYAFGRSMRVLQRYWFLFACLNVALGVFGLLMVQAGFSHQAGPWEPWPHPPLFQWTFLGLSAWTLLIVRIVLAGAASLGLRYRSDWARPVSVLAADVALTQFPMGLLLGTYTLVRVLGKRNAGMFKLFVMRRAEGVRS